MTENERVKQLRKARGLTLEKFGERIGIKKSALSQLENGKTSITDQTRRSICREFGVREEWLRDGTGEMETERPAAEELSDMVERLMSGESADFKRRFIAVLSNLREDEWVFLERKIQELSSASTPEQRARKRADDFYEEALAEEQAADEPSASPPTGAAGA